MIRLLVLLNLLLTNVFADSWKPPQGLRQVPVWPTDSKILLSGIKELDSKKILNRGIITNVSHPTYTVYSPPKNNGTAIIVFPGGGHKVLAIDLEGTEVCDWLIKSGITCVLLKYRVPYSGCYWDEKQKKHVTPDVPMALQDAQRTISTIRYDAKKYNIDPSKIGVMGFSAGGNLVVLLSTAFKKRSYMAIDEIDKVSSRPDFAIPVFPGHMTMEHKNKFPKKTASKELNSDIVISKEVPPTLLVHAKDDPVDPAYYSELYAKELEKANVKVKLHLYQTGGHAFAIRKQGKDSDRWPADALNWLKEIKML